MQGGGLLDFASAPIFSGPGPCPALHQAAEELHISQPSLSYSISELEKELGVKLFEKENRKISLTAYGEQFLPYVQRSLALLDEGAAVLEQMAGNLPQVAKLGYFHSISASLIPALVEGFYREEDNRSIRFQFTEGPSFDIFNQVKAGELDMASGCTGMTGPNRSSSCVSPCIWRSPATTPCCPPLRHL